jgi:hypothetical protein
MSMSGQSRVPLCPAAAMDEEDGRSRRRALRKQEIGKQRSGLTLCIPDPSTREKLPADGLSGFSCTCSLSPEKKKSRHTPYPIAPTKG